MNTPRIIAYILIALLISLIAAQRDRIKEEWAATDEEWRIVLALCALLIGTGILTWAAMPLYKYIG